MWVDLTSPNSSSSCFCVTFGNSSHYCSLAKRVRKWSRVQKLGLYLKRTQSKNKTVTSRRVGERDSHICSWVACTRETWENKERKQQTETWKPEIRKQGEGKLVIQCASFIVVFLTVDGALGEIPIDNVKTLNTDLLPNIRFLPLWLQQKFFTWTLVGTWSFWCKILRGNSEKGSLQMLHSSPFFGIIHISSISASR